MNDERTTQSPEAGVPPPQYGGELQDNFHGPEDRQKLLAGHADKVSDDHPMTVAVTDGIRQYEKWVENQLQ